MASSTRIHSSFRWRAYVRGCGGRAGGSVFHQSKCNTARGGRGGGNGGGGSQHGNKYLNRLIIIFESILSSSEPLCSCCAHVVRRREHQERMYKKCAPDYSYSLLLLLLLLFILFQGGTGEGWCRPPSSRSIDRIENHQDNDDAMARHDGQWVSMQ